MNEAQRKNLLAAAWGIARALGADLEPDKPEWEQNARGMAYLVGRLLKDSRLVRAVASLAAQYLPADVPPAKGDA